MAKTGSYITFYNYWSSDYSRVQHCGIRYKIIQACSISSSLHRSIVTGLLVPLRQVRGLQRSSSVAFLDISGVCATLFKRMGRLLWPSFSQLVFECIIILVILYTIIDINITYYFFCSMPHVTQRSGFGYLRTSLPSKHYNCSMTRILSSRDIYCKKKRPR